MDSSAQVWDGTCCRRGRLRAGLLTCLCSERLPELSHPGPLGATAEAPPPQPRQQPSPGGWGEARQTSLLDQPMANTLPQFEHFIKNNKNRHQKLGLTTIRHSCRLKEKRERHELMKPHDKSGSSRSVVGVRGPTAPGTGSRGHAGTSVRRALRSHFLSEPRPSRAGRGPRALRKSSPLSWEENKSRHV